MSDFVLTPAERALLEALNRLGVRYLIVGMGAALLEGAHGTTQDLDLWFGRIDEIAMREAAGQAGGFYTAGFGMQPPALGGDGLDRIDLVLSASGLESFDQEYQRSGDYSIDGVTLYYLSLRGKIVAVPIRVGTTLEAGAPTELFETRTPGGPLAVARRNFQPTPDGQRFLVRTLADDTSLAPFTVTTNWTADLKSRPGPPYMPQRFGVRAANAASSVGI